MRFYLLILFSFLLSSCSTTDAQPNIVDDPVADNPVIIVPENPLIQLNGTTVVDASQNPIQLQGVAFGNRIWDNTPVPSTLHHSELDYLRVQDMGMNAIRFYMNYRYFEDDNNPYSYKQTGWDWLDQNIAWAKKYGIYLILNMHAPQGGYQSQGTGDALWEDTANQDRLIALWQAIANRYKDEVQIAGFGPVNEPVPTVSMSQWSDLAQKIINGIRTVDPDRLIFIEKAIYVKGAYTMDENLNFPQVSGSNLVYEFHSYDPHAYTHQLFSWANRGDGGKYPDETILETVNGTWYTAAFGNPVVPAGNTDWTYFEGIKYTVNDPQISYAIPALIGARAGGRIYFDDVVINEYDANGVFTQTVFESNLNADNGWYYWSENGEGTSGISTTVGVSDHTSLYIEQATSDCNLTGSEHAFIPKQGFQYQINGWMKGSSLSENASCMFRIDFGHSDEPILKRNKEYLDWSIKRYVDWANSNNVPLYLGEFGAGVPCFENDKGGLQFVADMLEIIAKYDIHFTYHAYHEDSFGLFYGYNSLPQLNNANLGLINLFTQTLNQ